MVFIQSLITVFLILFSANSMASSGGCSSIPSGYFSNSEISVALDVYPALEQWSGFLIDDSIRSGQIDETSQAITLSLSDIFGVRELTFIPLKDDAYSIYYEFLNDIWVSEAQGNRDSSFFSFCKNDQHYFYHPDPKNSGFLKGFVILRTGEKAYL